SRGASEKRTCPAIGVRSARSGHVSMLGRIQTLHRIGGHGGSEKVVGSKEVRCWRCQEIGRIIALWFPNSSLGTSGKDQIPGPGGIRSGEPGLTPLFACGKPRCASDLR